MLNITDSFLLYFSFFWIPKWAASRVLTLVDVTGWGSWGSCWLPVLTEPCMVHGQVQGCNLSTGFTAGLRVTAKLPRVTRVINLVLCRINVVFKMIIYLLKLRHGCAQGGANSCARDIREGCSEGRRKIPACIVSPVQSRVTLMKIALEMQDWFVMSSALKSTFVEW